MKKKREIPAVAPLEERIFTIRDKKVILDTDLSAIYGVPTKRLNEQFRRNRDRFPADFAFQLSAAEWAVLRSQNATLNIEDASDKGVATNWSQIATSSKRHRGAAYRPYVFTEHGALMAANILNSARAITMSIFVIRAFVRMRACLSDTRELARKLSALEKEVTGRLDVHEAAIVEVLQRVMSILDPPAEPPPPPRPEIGFHAARPDPP